MKNRLLSIIVCLCLAMMLLPAVSIPAVAAGTVSYLDADGNTQTVSATQVTSYSSDSVPLTWNSGWYYVSGIVSISAVLTVSDTVNLILADDCVLTVQTPDTQTREAGIGVSLTNNLNIYAQSDGDHMGKLSASCVNDGFAAGIGGNYYSGGCGTITIVGGNVTATGSPSGAGIGGAYHGDCYKVNILGGNVTATGGYSSAGIGGGEDGDGGVVNISGGTVTATGGLGAAGIGGGSAGFGGEVNISGGTVTATSASSGAGIGSGVSGLYFVNGGSINISGGIVAASSLYGAGMGGGIGYANNSVVNITGGTITATSKFSSGIGGYSGGLVRITGGTITAASSGDDSASGAGIGGNTGGTVIITGGSVHASSAFGEPIGHSSSGTDSGTLTNGMERLYPTTVTLSGVSGETAVSAMNSSAAYFGITGMKTDTSGKLYLYLPEGSTITSVTASGNTYTGPITVVGSSAAGTLYTGTPVVSSVSLLANGIYKTGDTLSFTVHFSKAVTVTGSPYIPLTIGDTPVQAAYQSGSGSTALVFSYTIQTGDSDSNGIGIGGSVELNGGTVKDIGDSSADLTLNGVGSTSGILVGEQAPTVTISSATASPTNSSTFSVTITFSQSVTGFNPYSILTNGFVMDLSGSGTTYTALISYIMPPLHFGSTGSEADVTVSVLNYAARNEAGYWNIASDQFHMKIDQAAPSVSGVTPGSGAVDVVVLDDIAITFSEAINTASGTVSLTPSGGTASMLTGGSWSNENKTYTLSGVTLVYSTTYSLAVSGFTDLAGNALSSAWSGSFTTEPEPLGPSASPESLTLYRDGTASISVALGQGVAAASQAAVTVSDGSKISVTPALLTTNGSIAVSGLAAGQADITVAFDDSAHTSKTISVTVENAPPVWPTGSSLSTSRVTQSSATLNWTAANSIASIIGYKIYQDGKLIGFVNATALSYTVSGLSASTAYNFQVQAGNTDDAWSKDGPTFAVTTREEDGVAPTVSGVTPAGDEECVTVSGNAGITFSEEMYPALGTVSLTPSGGSTISFTGGEWSAGNTVYTVSYGGLSYSTAYTLFVSGFQDAAGNAMSAYACDFTTEPEPLTPAVSPSALTVSKGGSTFLAVAMGQGTAAAALALVTVDNASIASVNTSALAENGSVTVSGLTAGITDITVIFNDMSETEVTVSVTVEPVAPVWPPDSSLTASDVTQTGAILTWTAASDVTAVTGYRIYQNGALIGTVNSSTRTYSVSGLSVSTDYIFQVQAGNDDGMWTIDGPTDSVATSAFFSGNSSLTAFVVNSNGTLDSINVTASGGSAVAAMSTEQGNALADGDALELSMPTVRHTASYGVELPANDLSENTGGTLTMDTCLGSIVVPSNMLSSLSGASGKTAEISVGQGNKYNLPEDVRTAIGDRPLIQLILSVDGSQTDWSNPDAPVMVSIPYTPTAEELANPENIIIWYIDGSSNIVTIPNGHYDPATGTVTFSTTHFSQYAVGYNNVAFSDVAENAWCYNAVNFIAARGITGGTSDTAFSPDTALTRGQCITLLMRAYGINPDDNSADNFSDAGSTYYTGYLAAAKRLGITSGVGDNKFVPEQAISRQEMFTLLYNAMKEMNQLPEDDSGKTLSDFTDGGSISSYAQEALDYLVKTGVVSGNNGYLLPTATATRAQMAQTLYNLLGN